MAGLAIGREFCVDSAAAYKKKIIVKSVVKNISVMQGSCQFSQETAVTSLLKGFEFQHSVAAVAIINLDIELGSCSYLGDN